MGNFVTFKIPTLTSFDYCIIERSLTQSGSYSGLISTLISTNVFFDETGNSNHWYRTRFYDSGTTNYDNYSVGFQPDDVYCTPREVAAFMGYPNFTNATNPTWFEVEDLIANVCDQIDEDCHDAWRNTQVTNETHSARIQDRYMGYGNYPYDYTTRIAIYLKNRNIRTFISGTDKIEVWDGTNWIDYITTYTEDRAKDYWIDYERGIIYFVNRYPLRQRSNVRVSYHYGVTSVPNDIRQAAILITAAYLVGGKTDLAIVYPSSTLNFPGNGERWEKWIEMSHKLLQRKTHILSSRYY